MQTLLAIDIMEDPPVTLTPEQDVHEAIDLLLKYKLSNAPVVDDQSRLVGILSEKDCMSILIEGTLDNLPTTSVSALMRTNITSITGKTDLLSIAQIFMNKPYRVLPVLTEDGHIIGQVSRHNLLQAASKFMKPVKKKSPSFLYLSRITDAGEVPIS